MTGKSDDNLRGTWLGNDLRRAFVNGAKWWEWKSRGATMWQSDQRDSEAEAERLYPNGIPTVETERKEV